MTAIKSSTKKSTTASKSPTPATKSAPAKRASKKSAAAETATAVVTEASVAVLPPPVKPVTSKPVTTTIAARVDVGFGNVLFLRGEGPGLSWDKGVPMDCVSSDQWQLDLGESSRPFSVKFLVNDATWSAGPDYIVPSGVNVTLAPQF